jgi:hypothetical protein
MSDSILPRFNSKNGSVFRFFSFLVWICFIFLNIFLLGSLFVQSGLAFASFLLNFLILIYVITRHFKNKQISLFDTVVYSFFYVFFIASPVLQYSLNKFPYFYENNDKSIIFTNFILLIFICFYYLFKNHLNIKEHKKIIEINSNNYEEGMFCVFVIYSMISILLAGVYFKDLISMLLYRKFVSAFSMQEAQITLKLIFYIPVFPLYYLILKKESFKNQYLYWTLVLIFVFIVLLFKNPFNERRNSIGPLYLSFVFLAFGKYLKNKYSFALMILTLLFVFPFASLLTHSKISFGDNSIIGAYRAYDLYDKFASGDYDSWSMVLSAYSFVEEKGAVWGRQLIGALFFFVPRSLWPGKPYGTGHYLVNEYLFNAYGWKITNVSCPLPAEGYVNFGIMGVVFFAFLIAMLAKKCDIYSLCYQPLRKIFSVFVPLSAVMLLRGDLNSGFAYLVTPLISVYIIPKYVAFLISKSLTYNK